MYQIVMGLFGVRNCDKPERTGVCLVLVIIALAFQLVSAILSGVNWMTIVRFVLPVVYLVGAIRNRSSAR